MPPLSFTDEELDSLTTLAAAVTGPRYGGPDPQARISLSPIRRME